MTTPDDDDDMLSEKTLRWGIVCFMLIAIALIVGFTVSGAWDEPAVSFSTGPADECTPEETTP